MYYRKYFKIYHCVSDVFVWVVVMVMLFFFGVREHLLLYYCTTDFACRKAQNMQIQKMEFGV